jgi:hypothetical protein
MRFKQSIPEHSDAEEREASNELRSLLGAAELREQGPDEAYWHGLIARTNRRLDEAASSKAISISWAARVAIPGVVAIIFFFVGLHYYIPQPPPAVSPVREILLGLSNEDQDSLGDTLWREGLLGEDRYGEIFTVPRDEIEEYLVTGGHAELALETISEAQVLAFLDVLRSHQKIEPF